jgi:hypothetical protein
LRAPGASGQLERDLVRQCGRAWFKAAESARSRWWSKPVVTETTRTCTDDKGLTAGEVAARIKVGKTTFTRRFSRTPEQSSSSVHVLACIKFTFVSDPR